MRLPVSIWGCICLLVAGCASNPLGSTVKEPFSGSKYTSNQRFYRATGSGSSTMDQIAQGQAEMSARKQLAQQVQTHFEVVTDNYQKEVEGAVLEEAMTRFETLAREITQTTLTDLRLIDSEKFVNEAGKYTVYVAFEIKKSSMYRHMKKQARLDKQISKNALAEVERLLDLQIQQAEE